MVQECRLYIQLPLILQVLDVFVIQQLNLMGCLVKGCATYTWGSSSYGFVWIGDGSQIRLGVDLMDGGTFTWLRYALT
jgi:hypothetical protein